MLGFQYAKYMSYLYAPENSMCVYAVLRTAAVHHGGAWVTVVACCMAANTEREKNDDNDWFIQILTANQTVNLLENETINTVYQHFYNFKQLSQSHIGSESRRLFNQKNFAWKHENWNVVCAS